MPRRAPISTIVRPTWPRRSLRSSSSCIYLATLAPSTAMWDTSEYIAAAYVLGIPHPPGNPLFVLIGRVFAILPLGHLSVAMKVNILAALTSAVAAGMWFLITERILVGWLTERWQRMAGAAARGAHRRDRVHGLESVGREREGVHRVADGPRDHLLAHGSMVRRSRRPHGGPAARHDRVSARPRLRESHDGISRRPRRGGGGCRAPPATFLRWKLIAVSVGALLLGMSPFLTQPIRAAHLPADQRGRADHLERVPRTTSIAASTASRRSSTGRRPSPGSSACSGCTSSGSGCAM